MAQADLSIANGAGSTVRAAMNNLFAAVTTQHSGTSFPSDTNPFMVCNRTDLDILYQRNEADTAWEIMWNYGATVAPVAGDDDADGYRVNSEWSGPTLGAIYRCTDASTGSAVWADITASGSAVPGGSNGEIQYKSGSLFVGDSLIKRLSAGLLFARNLQGGFTNLGSGTGDWYPTPGDSGLVVTRSANFTIHSSNFTPPINNGWFTTSALLKNSGGSPISVIATQGTGNAEWQDVIGSASPFTVTTKRRVTLIGVRESASVAYKQIEISADTP